MPAVLDSEESPIWSRHYSEGELDAAMCAQLAAALQASHGRYCHSTLSLTGVDYHSLAIHTLILLSLLSFSAKMTVSPVATAGRR